MGPAFMMEASGAILEILEVILKNYAIQIRPFLLQ